MAESKSNRLEKRATELSFIQPLIHGCFALLSVIALIFFIFHNNSSISFMSFFSAVAFGIVWFYLFFK
jgi:hypothetical protein